MHAGREAREALMILLTERLELIPITLPLVEAVMRNDRVAAEKLTHAHFTERWPGRSLVEQAFCARMEEVRADPDTRLWGDRLMISRDGHRQVLGSVIFHGRPGPDGIAEVGYGVDAHHQRQGLATEATRAAISWALRQPGVRAVSATTFAVHRPSRRVLEKVGMHLVGMREHDLLGEMVIYEINRDVASGCEAAL